MNRAEQLIGAYLNVAAYRPESNEHRLAWTARAGFTDGYLAAIKELRSEAFARWYADSAFSGGSTSQDIADWLMREVPAPEKDDVTKEGG